MVKKKEVKPSLGASGRKGRLREITEKSVEKGAPPICLESRLGKKGKGKKPAEPCENKD